MKLRRLILAILPFLLFVIPTGTAQAKTVVPTPSASVSTSLAGYKIQAFKDTPHAHRLRYQVVSGDSLSAIAQKLWHNPAFWPSLWTANKALIGNNYNLVQVGWSLSIPAVPNSKMPLVTVAYSTPVKPVPVVHPSSSAGYAYESPNNFSGFQQCVIRAESGGNAQVMNSSGHYGLYQFSYSTWIGYGGNGADFGHASVAEQNQVFDNAMSHPGGNMNWTPYDGCQY